MEKEGLRAGSNAGILPAARRRHRMVVGALLPLLLAVFVSSLKADVQLERSGDMVVVSGGKGAKAWRIVYGAERSRSGGGDFSAALASVSPTRAYFSHGGWLRLLDTEKGTVIGRWHWPGEIIALKPAGGDLVDVTCDENAGGAASFKNTYRFDPAHPRLPFVIVENLLLQRLSRREVPYNFDGFPFGATTVSNSPAEIRRVLSEVSELARRDPFSPWFLAAKARLLQMSSDPEAKQTYKRVLEVPGSDFIEWFPVSAFLERQGEHELYEAAYERAYRDYIQRDYDPRLLIALIQRLILFVPWSSASGNPEDRRRDYLDHTYRLAPYEEGARVAWELFARELEKTGPADLARLWRARADDARQYGDFGFQEFPREFDRWGLVCLAGLMAAVVYVVVLNRRYKPQYSMDATAGRRRWSLLGSANVRYWDRRQRAGLLTLALLCWLAYGLAAGYMMAYLRVAASPLGPWLGNFAGPIAQRHFNRLPASPARSLLLAQAHLQSGDTAKAEELYRSLADFPQAWNNLGVIFKNAWRDKEANEAFERALQLDPQLHEATLNLGRGPTDFWTEQHAKYAPNNPMLATPPMSVIRGAYRGPLAQFLFAALGGPMRAHRMFREFQSGDWPWLGYVFYGVAVAVALLLLGSVFLLLAPRAEVTQGAGRGQSVMEKIFPGTSPYCGAFGGLVLAAWCFLIVQLALYLALGAPYVLGQAMTVNIARAFLIPVTTRQAAAVTSPSWVWLLAAPVVLFVGNLLFLRSKTRGSPPAAAAITTQTR
jgi:tetratricopeptide (TPR) repeat protein